MKVSFAHGLDGLGKGLMSAGPSKDAKNGKHLFQNYLKGIADKKAALRAKGRVFVDSESASEGDVATSDSSDGLAERPRGSLEGAVATGPALGPADEFDDPFFQVLI